MLIYEQGGSKCCSQPLQVDWHLTQTSRALQMIISMKWEVALMDSMNDDNASER